MNNKSQTNTICFCSHTFGNQTWETVDSRKPTICEGQQMSPPVWQNIAQNSNLWQIIQLFWCNCPRKAKLYSKFFGKLKPKNLTKWGQKELEEGQWKDSRWCQDQLTAQTSSSSFACLQCFTQLFAVLHPNICSAAPNYWPKEGWKFSFFVEWWKILKIGSCIPQISKQKNKSE